MSQSEKSSLRKVLKKFAKNTEPVTLIIKSGENCCEITGCILTVKKDLVILLTDDDPCRRIYVVIDCICAIKKPAEVEPPPPPPVDEECECQVTGAGITGPPPNNASIQIVACPGCTLEPSLVRYENNIGEEDVELILLPPGPGEIFSVSCEDDERAVIEGVGQVIIDGEDLGLCEFTLEVTDTPPPAPDTINMEIVCDGETVHESGELDLLGQSINILECPTNNS